MTMTWLTSDFFQAVANLSSVVIAVLALIVAINSERRARHQFEIQIEMQERIDTANLRPILTIIKSEYGNNRGIRLENAGLGTAVITSIEFEKNGKRTCSVIELFELDDEIEWDAFWVFTEKTYYLRADRTIHLAHLSEEGLSKKPEFTSDDKKRILDTVKEQIKGISIRIEYEDIQGNIQEAYTRTL